MKRSTRRSDGDLEARQALLRRRVATRASLATPAAGDVRYSPRRSQDRDTRSAWRSPEAEHDRRRRDARAGRPPSASGGRSSASEEIDWKNYPSLRRFVSERGKIRSRRITGLSRRQQSLVAKAVKRARTMGLLAYPGPGPASVRH